MSEWESEKREIEKERGGKGRKREIQTKRETKRDGKIDR